MSTTEMVSVAVELSGPDAPNQAEVAAAAFLARDSGRTPEVLGTPRNPRCHPRRCRRASGDDRGGFGRATVRLNVDQSRAPIS